MYLGLGVLLAMVAASGFRPRFAPPALAATAEVNHIYMSLLYISIFHYMIEQSLVIALVTHLLLVLNEQSENYKQFCERIVV